VIVYLNGALIDREHAAVSPFDRGFLFGDGVYEGLRAYDGVVHALERHERRLRAGLAECRIEGFEASRLGEVARAVLDANGLRDAFVYVQVTRGAPAADEPPRERVGGWRERPTVFAYASGAETLSETAAPRDVRVATRPDLRWRRGHVKGVSLLGNVISAYEALEADADEAILVVGWPDDSGVVSEGLATNVVASVDGEAVTPSLESASILEGVTRSVLLEAAPTIVERPVTFAELRRADEIALVGTRTLVARVSELDGAAMSAVGFSASLLEALKGRIAASLHSEHV
jgi:D-alanine transaminase